MIARWWLLCALVGALACGGGGSGATGSLPWEGDRAAVINPDGSVQVGSPGSAGECIPWEGNNYECIDPASECGEGAASDVIVDADGKVLEIVCYSTEDVISVEEVQAREGDIAQNQNNTVIALDGVDDGVDLEGDVAVDANNVVIYGEGPEVSVIAGDVRIDGNNTIVRGVRIEGEVEIVKNDSVLVYCVIVGDVSISANNTVVTGCDIFGSLTIQGNNTQLSRTRVSGQVVIEGDNTTCEQVLAFADTDEDHVVDEAEVGDAITCARRGAK